MTLPASSLYPGHPIPSLIIESQSQNILSWKWSTRITESNSWLIHKTTPKSNHMPKHCPSTSWTLVACYHDDCFREPVPVPDHSLGEEPFLISNPACFWSSFRYCSDAVWQLTLLRKRKDEERNWKVDDTCALWGELRVKEEKWTSSKEEKDEENKVGKTSIISLHANQFFTDLYNKSLNNGLQKQNQVPQSYQPEPVSVCLRYPSRSVYNTEQEHAVKWICPIIMTTSGSLEQPEVLCHLTVFALKLKCQGLLRGSNM